MCKFLQLSFSSAEPIQHISYDVLRYLTVQVRTQKMDLIIEKKNGNRLEKLSKDDPFRKSRLVEVENFYSNVAFEKKKRAFLMKKTGKEKETTFKKMEMELLMK